jgi:hypothetical protein
MRQVGEKMEINNLRKFTNGSILHSVVFREISLAEPMRVELTADQDGYLNATIYIHRPEDVTGGEWNHGKNGHGQTMVVR